MSQSLIQNTLHFEKQAYTTMLDLYANAMHSLDEAKQSTWQWKRANNLFSEACALVLGELSDEEFKLSQQLFRLAGAYLVELEIDVCDFPLLPVDPTRWTEVREAFDLCPEERG